VPWHVLRKDDRGIEMVYGTMVNITVVDFLRYQTGSTILQLKYDPTVSVYDRG
jgi:hypothetical protein